LFLFFLVVYSFPCGFLYVSFGVYTVSVCDHRRDLEWYLDLLNTYKS
jgi:hypothetical protein